MRTYTKIFYNKEKLEELFKLRKDGMSQYRLAEHFGVDRSSILYQLNKKESTGKNTRKIKHLVDPTKCSICTMLLSSPYHKKYPCKRPPVL